MFKKFGKNDTSVKMTLRISSLACFSVPWKRKSLFRRAERIQEEVFLVLTYKVHTFRYSKLRRLEILGPFHPPF